MSDAKLLSLPKLSKQAITIKVNVTYALDSFFLHVAKIQFESKGAGQRRH